MSNKLAKRASEELVSLAVEIREEHEACEHDAQSAVERAINCGRMLIEAKEKAGHGNWLPWLKQNFPADARTAQNYMRLASANTQRVSHLPMRDALAELAEPRAPQAEPTTAEMEGLDEPEEVDAEIVEDDPKPRPRRQPPADGPAHYLPDVVAEDADQNLRTVALRWFDQGQLVKDLLDKKREVTARSDQDRAAIKREAAVMERTARRLKESL